MPPAPAGSSATRAPVFASTIHTVNRWPSNTLSASRVPSGDGRAAPTYCRASARQSTRVFPLARSSSARWWRSPSASAYQYTRPSGLTAPPGPPRPSFTTSSRSRATS
jgi:hypothetical protein